MIDYKKIAEKHGVSEDTVREVERGIFQGVKYYIEKYPGIRILLRGLGSFFVRESRMRNLILRDYKDYRRGKYTKEQLKKRVKNNLEIKERVRDSRRKANGLH